MLVIFAVYFSSGRLEGNIAQIDMVAKLQGHAGLGDRPQGPAGLGDDPSMLG